MSGNREAAERELRDLIQLALDSVPYVRLDKVDGVIAMFERALEALVDSLEHPVEEIDRRIANNETSFFTNANDDLFAANRSAAAPAAGANPDARSGSPTPSIAAIATPKQEALISLATYGVTASDVQAAQPATPSESNSSHGHLGSLAGPGIAAGLGANPPPLHAQNSTSSSGGAGARGANSPVTTGFTRPLPMEAGPRKVTQDFESPSLRGRSITASGPAPPSARAAGPSALALQAQQQQQAQLQAQQHAAQQAAAQQAAAQQQAQQQAQLLAQQQQQQAAAAAAAAAAAEKAGPVLAKANVTKDYSSPRVSGRNLGAPRDAPAPSRFAQEAAAKTAAKAAPISGAAAAAEALPDPLASGSAGAAAAAASSAAAAAASAATAALAASRSNVRLPHEGPPGSPAQRHAHSVLLSLARPGSQADQTPAPAATQLNVAMPIAPGQFAPGAGPAGTGTPKPAYLKRLDSPDVRGGELLRSRRRLSALLQKSYAYAEFVKPELLAHVKSQYEQALRVLTEGCVKPSSHRG